MRHEAIRHEDVIDQLVDFVLGQASAADSLLIDEHLADCTACAEEVQSLAGIHRLAGVGAEGPSDESRRRLLDAALSARPAASAGTSVPAVQTWEVEIARFRELLGDIKAVGDARLWDAIAVERYDLTVRGLVCHLIAAESSWASRIGVPTIVPETASDHQERTRQTIARHREMAVEQTLEEFDKVTARTRLAVRGLDPSELRAGNVLLPAMSNETYVAFRAFEAWIHADDVRAAVDWPALAPPAPGLAAMGAFIDPWVTMAFARSDPELQDVGLRFVLDGPGGGSYDIGPGEPVAVIRTDVVDFCKLAGARLAAADLGYAATGDLTIARRAVEAIPLLAGM